MADDGDAPVFVVQRHDATTLHFDLRLEIGGVLVSWAVPKGPSLDPRDKRLAVRTDDHDLDHAHVEGRVGRSTVVVWDIGTFENVTEDAGGPSPAEEALAAGHLKVVLHGQKLTGAFALTQTRMGGDERNWLLVKVDDDSADRSHQPVTVQPESVISGKRNEDF